MAKPISKTVHGEWPRSAQLLEMAGSVRLSIKDRRTVTTEFLWLNRSSVRDLRDALTKMLARMPKRRGAK